MRTTWMASSRLAPPKQRVTLLSRQRLLGRFAGADLPRLTLVQAAAGFGKTTLLTQLLGEFRSRGMTVAWVAFEPGECDLHWLYAYLLVSLRRTNVQVPDAQHMSDDELLALPVSTLAGWVLAALESHETPTVLLLDDTHWIRSDVLSGELPAFVDRMPDHVRVVIASRTRLDGSFWRLAAQGQLDVIDDRDLRFTEEEMWALFDSAHDGGPGKADASRTAASQAEGLANPALLRRLMTATEGWPVALQLACIWSRDPRGQRNLERLAAGTGDLAQLLCEQLWSSIEEDRRQVLVRCAVFERMRADLIDHVLGRSDGGAFLEWLAAHTPIAVPLEGDASWYRCHSLFAEFLREQLRQLAPEEIASIHERAAEWFLARGLLQEAFRHAEQTGRSEFMTEIAERAGGWRIATGGGRVALSWLCRLPVADGRRHPRVRLAQVYSMAQDGLIREARLAFEGLRDATRDFTRGPHGRWDPSLAIDCETIDVILRIYEDRPIPPHSIFALERQIGSQPGLDRRVASLSSNLVCFGYYDVGDFESCLRFGRYGLERNRAMGLSYAETYLLLYMGMASFSLARPEDSRRYYKDALESATRLYGPQSNVAALACVLLARLELEGGEIDRARSLLSGAFDAVLERDGWYDIFAAGFDTAFWLGLLESGEPGALQALESVARQARSRGLERLALLVELRRAELRLRAGDGAEVARLLQEARHYETLADTTNPAPRDLGLVAAFHEIEARYHWLMGDLDTALGVARALEKRLRLSGLLYEHIRSQLLELACAVAAGKPPGREWLERVLGAAVRANMVLSVAESGSAVQAVLAGVARDPAEAAFVDRAGRVAQRLPSPSQPHTSTSGTREALLSPREMEVLRQLVNGCSNKEIARILDIAESTVKTYKERLYEKLQVSSRSAAIRRAQSLGLLNR